MCAADDTAACCGTIEFADCGDCWRFASRDGLGMAADSSMTTYRGRFVLRCTEFDKALSQGEVLFEIAWVLRRNVSLWLDGGVAGTAELPAWRVVLPV